MVGNGVWYSSKLWYCTEICISIFDAQFARRYHLSFMYGLMQNEPASIQGDWAASSWSAIATSNWVATHWKVFHSNCNVFTIRYFHVLTWLYASVHKKTIVVNKNCLRTKLPHWKSFRAIHPVQKHSTSWSKAAIAAASRASESIM